MPLKYLSPMVDNIDNDWRKLKPGDIIRIVRFPSQLSEPHYHNGEWEETFSLYHELISSQEALLITAIDEHGRPLIEYESMDKDGTMVSHALAMDDDSWERAG